MKKFISAILILVFSTFQTLPAYAWGFWGNSNNDASTIESYRPHESSVSTPQTNWFSNAMSNVSNFMANVGNSIKNFASNVTNFIQNVAKFIAHPIQSIKDWMNDSSAPNVEIKQNEQLSTDLDQAKELETKLNDDTAIFKSGEFTKDEIDQIVAAKWLESKGNEIPESTKELIQKYEKVKAEYNSTTEKSELIEPANQSPAQNQEPQAKANPKAQEISNVQNPTRLSQAQMDAMNNNVQLAQTAPTLEKEDMVSFAKVKQENPKLLNVDNLKNKTKSLVNSSVAIGKDTAKEIVNNWDKNDNSAESFSKGLIDGAILGNDTTIDDSYWAHQKLAFKAEEGLANVADTAYAYYNDLDSKADSYDNSIAKFGLNAVAKSGKALTFAGTVLGGTVIDVFKFGTEINSIARSCGEAKANFAMGNNKAGWRAVGQALGGVTKEAGRVAIVVSAAGTALKKAGKTTAKTAINNLDDTADDVVKTIVNKADDYTPLVKSNLGEIKKASNELKKIGYNKVDRRKILSSFDLGTVRIKQADVNSFGLRYYDGVKAQAKGQYLFDTFPQSRKSLALKKSWNDMTNFKQWKIKDGASFIEGNAASQGVRLSGGSKQKFVIDRKNIIEVVDNVR